MLITQYTILQLKFVYIDALFFVSSQDWNRISQDCLNIKDYCDVYHLIYILTTLIFLYINALLLNTSHNKDKI